MTTWKLIIDTYNALPVSDRTTRQVHRVLLDQKQSISVARVRDVLSATVLSDVLSEDDVRIAARTLKTLLDISCDMPVEDEPTTTETHYAEALTKPLGSIAGSSARDLSKVLVGMMTGYRVAEEVVRQVDYLDRMDELRHCGEDDFVF